MMNYYEKQKTKQKKTTLADDEMPDLVRPDFQSRAPLFLRR